MSENKGEQIVAIARQLFERNGVKQTTVSNIMDQAGMARESFYYHFRSKDELIDTVLDSYAELFGNGFKQWSDALDAGEASFDDFVHYLRCGYDGDGSYVSAMVRIARESKRIDSVTIRLADSTVEALRSTSFFQLCQRCSPIRADRAVRYALYATLLILLSGEEFEDDEMARMSRAALNIPQSL